MSNEHRRRTRLAWMLAAVGIVIAAGAWPAGAYDGVDTQLATRSFSLLDIEAGSGLKIRIGSIRF